jgi:ribonuclease BN (tRNA processing enzyme)
MITLTFLGVGSAFAKRNFNSNILLEYWKTPGATPDDVMLVDFGFTGSMALHKLMQSDSYAYLRTPQGLPNYAAIKKVMITHQHGDHCAGLEEMGWANCFLFKHKPTLYAASDVVSELWAALRPGLDTIPGKDDVAITDFFNPVVLDKTAYGAASFEFGDCVITPHRADHVRRHRKYDWPCYGFTVSNGSSSAFYSGDSRFDHANTALMSKARICFHDCMMLNIPNVPHATVWDLATLPEDIKRKTFLYHYEDNFDAESLEEMTRQFGGLAKQGERVVLLD